MISHHAVGNCVQARQMSDGDVIEKARIARPGTCPGNHPAQAWLGLAWLGLAWLGLAWLGLAWLGLAWLGKMMLVICVMSCAKVEVFLNRSIKFGFCHSASAPDCLACCASGRIEVRHLAVTANVACCRMHGEHQKQYIMQGRITIAIDETVYDGLMRVCHCSL